MFNERGYGMGWVLQELNSSTGSVSLTCDLSLQPSRALSSFCGCTEGLDGVWCSLALGQKCKVGFLVKGALEEPKHYYSPNS